MPLHIGNTNIGAIYKGTTPISSIYKGTTLVYTSFSWKEWYNEYIYNAIIPQKVNKTIGLPETYQEVEYIESSGTQYIQLGFGFDDTDELYTRFAMDISQGGGDKFLISPISWNENNNRFALGLYNGYYTFGYGTMGTLNGRFSPLTSNDGKPHNWSYKNHIAQVIDLSLSSNVSETTFGGTTATLRLFYGHQQPSICKLYSYKHYKNNVLIINLIPCYRKADNVIGLFDIVNQVFYTNAGTGTFTKGNDVYKLVQDKAKLFEVEGNGVIENQLCDFTVDFGTKQVNGITIETNLTNKTIRYHGTAIANATCGFISSANDKNNLIVGHKYLLKLNKIGNSGNSKCSVVGLSGSWLDIQDNIYTGISASQYGQMLIYSGQTVDFTIKYEIIDLTQRYGTGLEPTFLTDNRIQKLIARGYIPFNTGTYKSTIVGEVVANGYNLFDKDNTIYHNDTYLGSDNSFVGSQNYNSTISYIEIEPNQTYNLENANPNQGSNPAICFYDINKDFISGTKYMGSNDLSFTTPANAFYCRFSIGKTATNVSLHRTGTRTGYADYIQQQYLPSEYQEVEYLESTGTQYIDTGLTINQNSRIKITYQYNVDTGNATRVFGNGYNNVGYVISTQSSSINTKIQTMFGSGWSPSSSDQESVIPSTNKIELEQVGNLQYVNGSLYYTMSSSTTFTTGSNATVFGAYYNNLGLSKVRIYGLSIWQNGTDLSRKFIPCYRKSDNVAGLYDLVNNLFYTNNGTGTFNVGKKVNNNTMIKLPAPLDLGGARNSHNKFEIIKTEYVFTRNNVLGKVSDILPTNNTWTKTSSIAWYSNTISSIVKRPQDDSSSIADLFIIGYNTVHSAYSIDMNCSLRASDGRLFIANSNWQNYTSTQVADNVKDLTIVYPLSTPQVIRIPRKHLGCVDLGSLNWVFNSTYNIFTASLPSAKPSSSSTSLANIYCPLYFTNGFNTIRDNTSNNMQVGINTASTVGIRNLTYTNATDFKNAMSGTYLYYETQDEVQDFNYEMFIQSGGTVNAYWFSWKKNQLVDKARSGGNIITGITATKIDNQTLSLTGNYSNSSGNNTWFDTSLTIPYVVGHKYLCIAKILSGSVSSSSLDENTNYIAICPNITERGNYVLRCFNNFGTKAQIIDLSSSMTTGNEYWRIRVMGDITLTNYTVRVNTIDLTVAFPTNTPTNINDPRVQRIIELGYIPTDTVGTETHEFGGELANLTLNLKSK